MASDLRVCVYWSLAEIDPPAAQLGQLLPLLQSLYHNLAKRLVLPIHLPDSQLGHMEGTTAPVFVRLGACGVRPVSLPYSYRPPGAKHRRSIDSSSSPIHRPSLGEFAHGAVESLLELNPPARTSEGPWFNISAPLEAGYGGREQEN